LVLCIMQVSTVHRCISLSTTRTASEAMMVKLSMIWPSGSSHRFLAFHLQYASSLCWQWFTFTLQGSERIIMIAKDRRIVVVAVWHLRVCSFLTKATLSVLAYRIAYREDRYRSQTRTAAVSHSLACCCYCSHWKRIHSEIGQHPIPLHSLLLHVSYHHIDRLSFSQSNAINPR
jgi:hypothetical protein